MSNNGDQQSATLANAFTCPNCGKKAGVETTRPPFRYRKCRSCGLTFKTQEVYQKVVDETLTGMHTIFEALHGNGVIPATGGR